MCDRMSELLKRSAWSEVLLACSALLSHTLSLIGSCDLTSLLTVERFLWSYIAS